MKRGILILLAIWLCVPALAERPETADMPILRARVKAWDLRAFEDALMDGYRTGATFDSHGTLEYEEPDTGFTAGMTDYGDGVVQYEYARILRLYDVGAFQYSAPSLSLTDVMAIGRWDADGRDERGEIAGFAPDAAQAVLRDTLDRLGIEMGAIVRYTAMDEGMLAKCRDNYVAMVDGEDDWGTDNPEARLLAVKKRRDLMAQIPLPEPGYCIRARINYRGVPLTCMPDQKHGFDDYAPGDLLAYVTKRGVLSLETTAGATVYEIVAEKKPDRAACTAEAARKRLLKLYGNRATVVERVCFEYVPVPLKKKGEYMLRPAWAFYTTWGGPHYIDAYTGKEL